MEIFLWYATDVTFHQWMTLALNIIKNKTKNPAELNRGANAVVCATVPPIVLIISFFYSTFLSGAYGRTE